MKPYVIALGIISLSAILSVATAGAMGTAALLPFLLSPNYPDGLFFGQRYDSIVNIGGLVVWACAAVLFVVLVTKFLFFRTSPKSEATN